MIRDGLGLELLDASHTVVAEVFRCDADHTVTVRVFQESIPSSILAELVEMSRRELGSFEDGTALPEDFTYERAD